MNTIQDMKQFTKVAKTQTHSAHPAFNQQELDDLVEALNENLSHAIDLRSRIKQAYWNAKGGNFYALHKMFDRFSNDIDSIADEFASRVMALGGTPVWTPAIVAKKSKLPAYPTSATQAEEHLKALVESYEAANRHLPAIMTRAAKLGDHATASLLTGFTKLLEEHVSFFAAHISEDWPRANRPKPLLS